MLNDKIVLITGASSGLGREISWLIAENGGIPILMARSEDKLQLLASKIERDIPHATRAPIFPLDVTNTEQVNTVMREIWSRFGKIDVLINNAGYGVFAPIEQQSIDEFEQMMNVNYLGTVRCIKAALPYMQKQKVGHIINVSSVAGKIGTAKATAYAATKHAVIGFSESLRQELAGTGITISTLCPGPINTPFFDRADPAGSYKKNIKSFMLSPQEVAWEVIDMILKKPADRTIPGIAHFGVKIYHLFPRTFTRILGKQLNRK